MTRTDTLNLDVSDTQTWASVSNDWFELWKVKIVIIWLSVLVCPIIQSIYDIQL
jgi:hypothetical protein